MKKCKGCGVILQTEDPTKLGYAKAADHEFCQRCFRMNHYGDLTFDVKNSIQPDTILAEVEQLPGLIVWVVDLWDLSGSFKLPINRYLGGRDIVLALTKRDLLPETFSAKKLTDFLFSQLKENQIQVKAIAVLANHGRDGLKELKEIIKTYAGNKEVILLGNANSGKSTLLRALTDSEVTISRFPGTTLAISAYQMADYTIYDTPGLMNKGSCLQYLDTDDLDQLIAKRFPKLPSYQVYENQSFAIGGLVRLDLNKVKKATLVFYCAETLAIHRGKTKAADELWQKHYGKMLKPIIGELSDFREYTFRKTDDKIDICINGLGFVAISGEVASITVKCNKNIDITKREGMI